MTFKMTAAAGSFLLSMIVGHAQAADVDFTRFLATPAGASGIAAAVAGLGHCDTPLSWGYAYDESLDRENTDHLFVACQFDPDWEEGDELYDKSVIAKFMFLEGEPSLESLSYLP
ncbi:hypothetical protein [uncultured Roseibium sp.]|uniref:hypothetical protein n=1 Tax=uncultured Roseibium sp. TaxID=1936171 RepID=UPI003217E420